jgi:hypothetical protein|tara:strand:- start:135 stop:548 length:414 start_codon:yes stop_codon:yes gene_type:complete
MTVHLKKLAVGISSIENLKDRQSFIFDTYGEIINFTRNKPKRVDELIEGGSLYWIINRKVFVRQKILEIKSFVLEDGKKSAGIVLQNKLIRVRPVSMKPFQGWRYYQKSDVPPDIDDDNFSDENNVELSKLGFISKQ